MSEKFLTSIKTKFDTIVKGASSRAIPIVKDEVTKALGDSKDEMIRKGMRFLTVGCGLAMSIIAVKNPNTPIFTPKAPVDRGIYIIYNEVTNNYYKEACSNGRE